MEQDKKLSVQQENSLLHSVFTTPGGVRALEILDKYFYDRPSYNPSEPQPYHTFFREGQRDVVGFIREAIEAARNPNITVKRR